MPVYRENQPSADALMTSMRSMGYTFESALADIVDNSVSAGSSRIDIRFPVDPANIFVAICDNGCGMSQEELFAAMKYGSKHRDEQRDEKDLGRFGLGLKSASLSQARKLTVISKKNDTISACKWDLDYIEKEKTWSLAILSEDEIKEISQSSYLYDKKHGTVVLWEDFDIIEKSSGMVYSELLKLAESSAEHLSLTFHRFINRDKNKIDIYVNVRKLDGYDPFLETHPKTDRKRKRSVFVKDSHGIRQEITVQPFVLPFIRDLSKEDQRKSGGIENYRTKQGFYIYRNERLIIYGSWFGRHRDELTKYARVKVDIPNTLDDIWSIDIKKQNAKIPGNIRNNLTAAVDEAMDRSVNKQTKRSRKENPNDSIDYIWERIKTDTDGGNTFVYKINRSAKIFDLLSDVSDSNVLSRLELILAEIESNIPYQQIYIDKCRNKVDETVTDERMQEIISNGKMLLKIMISGGQKKDSAIKLLMKNEPFCNHPGIEMKILED